MHLTVHDEEMLADAAIVANGLDAANEGFAPLRDVQPLSVFARDDAGGVIGGAVGRTWGECCELRYLWVATSQRGRRIGSRLVSAFERRAAERGCLLVYLETFSFQARPFYEALGYATALEITGFAEGVSKCMMTHALPTGEAPDGH